MAVLEKIRVKLGAFITLIIGVALLSFIVDADTLRSAISMFSSKYDIGEMNGKSIRYQEFQKKIDYYTKIQQILTGSATMDEKTQEMVNQSAWQDYLNEEVIIPQIEKSGVNVGEEEMVDLSQGKYISPVLLRERSFAGADGQFDREMFLQFIKAIPQDNSGNLSVYWKYLENNMKLEQFLTKYISLLAKSTIQNPVELRRTIQENNVTSDVSFIIQPYGLGPDSTVTVSKQEIRDYYNKNRKNFEQKATRDIEYVIFKVTPSEKDIDMAKADIDKAYEDFAKIPVSNLRSFLSKNSDKGLNPYYFKEGELSSVSPVLDSFAFKASIASVLPVFQEGNTFRAARINSVKMLPDSVFVQHILIQGNDQVKIAATVDSLMQVLKKGADFATLAATYSADRNPNAAPGDIGWMTQEYMIPGFDTCFVSAPGTLIPVETKYGHHIVRVKERTKPLKKVQLAVLEKIALASKETYQDYYSKANELSSKAAGNFEKFNAAVKEMNLVAVPAVGIEQGAKTVATYKNARELSRWVYEAKKGDVSQIISIEDNKYFVVAALTAVRQEGIPELVSLEPQIEALLKMEKTNSKLVDNVRERVKGMNTLEEMATALGSMVSKQNGISFGALGSQSFDPKFVGAVAGSEVNKITGPVGGNVGVYIFNVDNRQTGGFYTEDDAKAKSLQLFNYQMQMLLPTLEKLASVKDFRAKFF
jgi:peptidyl-prolyl cis-trans isomerase D